MQTSMAKRKKINNWALDRQQLHTCFQHQSCLTCHSCLPRTVSGPESEELAGISNAILLIDRGAGWICLWVEQFQARGHDISDSCASNATPVWINLQSFLSWVPNVLLVPNIHSPIFPNGLINKRFITRRLTLQVWPCNNLSISRARVGPHCFNLALGSSTGGLRALGQKTSYDSRCSKTIILSSCCSPWNWGL